MTDDRTEERASLESGEALHKPVKLRPALKRIQRFGWGLFALWLATLVVVALIWPDPYAQGWRLVLELLFLGRAVSIADGIARTGAKIQRFRRSLGC